MNLIFLGPPGAGKGTQAKRICEKYKLTQIATGDILREHLRNETGLGKKAREFINAGNLVPNDLIIDMMRYEIEKNRSKGGFLLDGFPRTVTQAEALDELLKELNEKLDVAIVLNVPKEELIDRLTGRRVCPQCGTSYHLIFNPPNDDSKCDHDGEILIQRKDDNEETVKNRLDVYEKETKPIIHYYEKKGLAYSVDGVGSVSEIFDRINEGINSYV
ncbi:adenylate kinase [bacterium]|nr:MAG: adenylate kinase [bacterium]